MADSSTEPGPSIRHRTESTTSNSTTNRDTSTSSSTSTTPPVNMTEYCKSLETWLGNVYMQRNCAMSAYFTAYSLVFGNNSHVYSTFNNNINNGASTSAARGAEPGGFRNGANRVNLDANQNPVYEFVHQYRVETLQIAPVWKRLMAEAFDFVLLLLVKIFVTISLIDNFELIDLDNLELEALQDSNNIYEIAVSLTWELIILEITHRIIVCFFEAYCLSKSGYTPGKNLFGLRVIQCQSIQEINNRIVISPGTNLSFGRALLRSVLKNFSIALFFPMCFTVIHFENNQTLYDHISKSIVVSY